MENTSKVSQRKRFPSNVFSFDLLFIVDESLTGIEVSSLSVEFVNNVYDELLIAFEKEKS